MVGAKNYPENCSGLCSRMQFENVTVNTIEWLQLQSLQQAKIWTCLQLYGFLGHKLYELGIWHLAVLLVLQAHPTGKLMVWSNPCNHFVSSPESGGAYFTRIANGVLIISVGGSANLDSICTSY